MANLIGRLILALLPGYTRLRYDLNTLQATLEQLMAKQEDFDVRMSDFDTAMTDIETALQALRDEIAGAGTISDANLATIDAKIARLKAIANPPL